MTANAIATAPATIATRPGRIRSASLIAVEPPSFVGCLVEQPNRPSLRARALRNPRTSSGRSDSIGPWARRNRRLTARSETLGRLFDVRDTPCRRHRRRERPGLRDGRGARRLRSTRDTRGHRRATARGVGRAPASTAARTRAASSPTYATRVRCSRSSTASWLRRAASTWRSRTPGSLRSPAFASTEARRSTRCSDRTGTACST